MKLHRMTGKDWSDYTVLTEPLRDNEYVRLMEDFIQHGDITTYKHVLSVAQMAFYINRRLSLKADEKDLLTGAILHDFFLYDWHGTDQGKKVMTPGIKRMREKNEFFRKLPKSRITGAAVGIGPGNWTHSYKHPLIACENAVKIFGINEKQQQIISCHMWPISITRIPGCREAWIVCLADKYCSLTETLFERGSRKGKM